MSQAVIDTSVSAAWVLKDEATEQSWQLLDRVLAGRVVPVVPALWHYEMLNVLRTAVGIERVTAIEAARLTDLLDRLPVEIVPVEAQGAAAILTAALDRDLSAYDAAYFSLAQRRGLQLITADGRILRLRSTYPRICTLDAFLNDA